MIEAYWGLARKPFANTPDPAFAFLSPVFEEGLARLVYDATELRGGLSLITGEIGCGKTMLTEALRAKLAGTPFEPMVLPYPRLTSAQLLQALAGEFGLEKPPRGKAALVAAIGARLRELHASGRRVVLLVDEAQLASPSLLEEIRLLTNFEDRTDKHIHVVLLGQPELRQRIGRRPQINQRIGLRFHLEPMEPEDVRGYVAHRLKVAGAQREPFADSALDVLAERTRGVPRLVNNVATQALFVGAMRRVQRIEPDLVTDVADERE